MGNRRTTGNRTTTLLTQVNQWLIDLALPTEIIILAEANGISLATVESCTGGLVAHLITSVPGASSVFRAGLVTYHNKAKQGLVNVEARVLDSAGAVSAPCAAQMVLGGVDASGADLVVAITGIAGPGGGSAEKPVGTIFWALARPGRLCAILKGQLPYDRHGNQRAAAALALKLLQREMTGTPMAGQYQDVTLLDARGEYHQWMSSL